MVIPDTVYAFSEQGARRAIASDTLVFPEGVKRIDDIRGTTSDMDGSDPSRHVDFKDKNWDKVIMPDSLETIGNYTFSSLRRSSSTNNNPTVGKLILSKNLKTVEHDAFHGCIIDDLNLPEGLETIEDSAFENSGLLDGLIIPSSVKRIGDRAFGIIAFIMSIYQRVPLSVMMLSGNNLLSLNGLVKTLLVFKL